MSEKSSPIILSKKYERTVNLSAVSSQYDKISLSSFVSIEADINDDMDELRKKMRKLNALVVSETERDIKEGFINLMKMARDKENLALVGTGKTLQIEAKPEVVEEVPVKAPKSEKKTPKLDLNNLDSKLEDVNLDDFNPADYEDGFLK